mmetsp:Transcript_64658/g.131465  ORF Transcript_64658/g.131465 Transcript_64658/m.131465 type:complete len:846 (-) Transcript_64658:209-2746(-)
MLTATVLSWLLFFVTAHAYETWHLVDLSQVICPKPTSSMTDAPEFPEYNLGINYTNELQVDAPHIVGFIRASKQAVSITFKIEDFYGEQVVPETTVELQEGSDAIPSACSCTNPNVPPEVSATYGVGYGSSCGKWDEARCGTLWGNITVGDWCCRSWCYATADCPDAYQSQAIPGQFFSYAACSVTHPPPSTCSWSEVQKKADPCTCKDQSSLFNAAMQAKFVDSYGSSCSAWDMVNCAANYRPDQVDTWCCANWCYVDKECPSAVASLNPGMEGVLYWSDNVCVDDPALMLQCPYQPQPNVSASDTSCDCLDATMPSELITSLGLDLTTYADYGRQCGPHDADVCDKTYPGADHAMWCCTSWCWVSATCPTARASTVWQGYYWSQEKCELNAEAVSGCKWESLCECRGQLPAGTFDGNGNFAADYGSSCSAWDSVNCKVVWGSDADSSWNTSSDHEWCCDSWCYVNEACPIAKKSWLGIGFYFSYETCDDPATTYNEQTDSCDPLRRLSARRRFGGGGGWSFGGSRRRSPWAASTSARHRSWSAPSTVSQRRRAPPPPAVRRRAPPPPVPSPTEGRRRSSSLSGQTFSTTPRRRATSSVEASLRRRRTIPETPYGYANRPHMMNNYGGTMPYQTPYGYTGYNAIPQQSSPNVAMYGAAGFVGGLGAAYMYNNMYSDSWGMHRRRRYGDFHNQNFCIVTDPGSRNGAFMACEQCYHLYGFSSCPSADSCRTATGCRYTTPQSYSRDELAATGFIPQAYTPPLKVIFTSITGQGIDTASICPPLTPADVALAEQFNRTMSFKPELFLVLSRQDVVEAVEQTGAGAATGFAPSAALLLMLVLPHLHK